MVVKWRNDDLGPTSYLRIGFALYSYTIQQRVSLAIQFMHCGRPNRFIFVGIVSLTPAIG